MLSAPPLQLIPRNYVHMTKASELKGRYVNEAQQLVRSAMEAARGGILFIDEAYSLGDGMYGAGAVEELLTLTDNNPAYENTIVVLAGYKENMDSMLNSNQGLKSRFRDAWSFPDWTVDHCVNLCTELASKDSIALEEDAQRALADGFLRLMHCTELGPDALTGRLLPRPGWANARDVIGIYSDMLEQRSDRVMTAGGGEEARPRFSVEDVSAAIAGLLRHRPPGVSLSANTREEARRARPADSVPGQDAPGQRQRQQYGEPLPPVNNVSYKHSQRQQQQRRDETSVTIGPDEGEDSEDGGHMHKSTAELEQLQQREQQQWVDLGPEKQSALKMQFEAQLAEQLAEAQAATENAERLLQEQQEREQEALRALQEQLERERGEEEQAAAARLKRAQEREQELREKLRQEQEVAEARLLEARRVEKERKVQQRIRQLGRCVMLFEWIKCSGGYRCAGGGHFLSDAEVGTGMG